MTPTGCEHAQQYSTFEPSAEILAKISAVAGDSEFAIVLAAWPTLPVEVRSAIVRLVEAATPGLTPDQCDLIDSADADAVREKRA